MGDDNEDWMINSEWGVWKPLPILLGARGRRELLQRGSGA